MAPSWLTFLYVLPALLVLLLVLNTPRFRELSRPFHGQTWRVSGAEGKPMPPHYESCMFSGPVPLCTRAPLLLQSAFSGTTMLSSQV